MDITRKQSYSPFREFWFGCIGGLVGQTVCHPFDTVKTRIQASTTPYSILKDVRSNGLLTFWRGLAAPLTSVIIEKSLLFSSYDLIRHNFSLNSFQSGVLSGILTTLTVTPFERVKIKAQTENRGTYQALRNVIKHDGVRSIYRGWSATLIREVPGYGLYFWAYEHSKKSMGDPSPWKSFLTGSISGVTAWIVIYPSDPIKTVMQNQNIGIRQAILQIYTAHGMHGFYRGYLWALARAAILHGGVFLGYESAKKNLS